jgi:hypothetical protein
LWPCWEQGYVGNDYDNATEKQKNAYTNSVGLKIWIFTSNFADDDTQENEDDRDNDDRKYQYHNW